MAIAQQEIFAPIMAVMRYDTLEEAVELANGTRYGLGASVFGRSRHECRYVMDRLECGMVCSNGAPLASSLLFFRLEQLRHPLIAQKLLHPGVAASGY
jgi:acyl-CoA reductase-like NAD-dependent aldehyde dehydrogenase